MNRRLIIRPEAEADITDGAVWYESRGTDLGLELLLEIHAAIARAFKNPESLHTCSSQSSRSSGSHATVSLSCFLHCSARCNSGFCCASRSKTRSSLETPRRT